MRIVSRVERTLPLHMYLYICTCTYNFNNIESVAAL